MRRGSWHQCGDRSQRIVMEQLQLGAGVGVIISPRDISFPKAVQYARNYHELNAHVLIDQQFYVPDFSNRFSESYPINQYRAKVAQPQQITDDDLAGIADALRVTHNDLSADGLIAPALVYEAGRSDIIHLNFRLFSTAKQVGDNLGIPTYATVVLGRSVTSSDQTLEAILAPVTSLNSDGWYFGFEFEPERIPSSYDAVYRCCSTGLTLASTGKPVLHAYAGPMSLLSLGFGATATAIGHSHNLWKFTRGRWQPSIQRRGGEGAPSRFFSKSLWGTIVYPDEVAELSTAFQAQVLTPSPFSEQLSVGQPFIPFSRWDSNKHLVYIVLSSIAGLAENSDPRVNANSAIAILQDAISLHGNIAGAGLSLRDNTNAYQENWRAALSNLLNNRSDDYDYLDLLD